MTLTAPLKCWKDTEGRIVYRLGDLPVGVQFRITSQDPILETIDIPRNSRAGKRQCRNTETGVYQYEYCSKKVHVISKDLENR
jgi:hypothetical protein